MNVISVAIFIILVTTAFVTTAFGQVLVVENEPAPGNGYRLGSEYTLHCQGSLGSGCSIRWVRNSTVLDDTSERIQVIVEPGSARYGCSFVCNGGQDVTQSDPKILSGQNLIRVEVLNSGVPGTDWKPLENSTMELTCTFQMLSFEFTKGIEEAIRPAFQWTVDGDVMSDQQTLTFVAVPGYDKSIQCTATYRSEVLTSAVVSVQATDEAEEPEVMIMRRGTNDSPSLFTTGGDYTAYCVSKSHSASATYLWTKDYFTIPNTPASRTFVIDSANGDFDDGVYRCRMGIQTKQYCSRSSVAMQVQAAGRFCQSETDCLVGDRYTQRCQNSRCECASGFTPQGDVCAGMAPLLASGFLVVCTTIYSSLLLL